MSTDQGVAFSRASHALESVRRTSHSSPLGSEKNPARRIEDPVKAVNLLLLRLRVATSACSGDSGVSPNPW